MNIFSAVLFLFSMLLLVFAPLPAAICFVISVWLIFADAIPVRILIFLARITRSYVVILKDSLGEPRASIADIGIDGEMFTYWYWNIKTRYLRLEDSGVVYKDKIVWRYADGQSTPDYTKGWKKDGKTK